MKPRPPFLAWPGRRVLTKAVVLGTAQTVWWMLVYYGADWATGMRSTRVRVHLDAETPGFANFLAEIDGGPKHSVATIFLWQLHPGRNRLKVQPRSELGRDGIDSWT